MAGVPKKRAPVTRDRIAAGVAVVRLLGLRGTAQAAQALLGIEQEGAVRPILARVGVALTREDVGCEVAVLFENGDPQRPLVMGVVRPWPLQSEEEQAMPSPAQDLAIDGERLILTGKREIVLRCGKASITLTRAGKVLVRGAHLSSRSSGANRIKGGSVQLN
jgi:hypothetical protein